MKRNGRLLMDLYVQPGTTHMSSLMEMPGQGFRKAVFKKIYDHFIDLGRPPVTLPDPMS